MNGNAVALGDKADDIFSGERVAALGKLYVYVDLADYNDAGVALLGDKGRGLCGDGSGVLLCVAVLEPLEYS